MRGVTGDGAMSHTAMSIQRGIAALLLLLPAASAWAQVGGEWEQTDPRYGLLSPIPVNGGVPPIVDIMQGRTAADLDHRTRARQYTKTIRQIAHKYLGRIRVESIRAQGLAELKELTDPAAFMPMIRELDREADDVHLAVLDHFAGQGPAGQAALAWVAIYDDGAGDRYQAASRVTAPPSEPVLGVLDKALRSPKHEVASNAGALAGAVNALRTIPLLIIAQTSSDTVTQQGDLAWIAIQTQRPFVRALIPIVNDNVAAFQPIVGVLGEGVVMRVVDAVVVVYRTPVHRSLVAMTTSDWGQSTAGFGYDNRGWWEWYNNQYVPFKNEEARVARLAAEERD